MSTPGLEDGQSHLHRTPAQANPHAAPACPPHHVEYLSRMLADNAVILHGIAYPACGGFAPFECGDHFHVGHPDPALGQACKAAGEAERTRSRWRP